MSKEILQSDKQKHVQAEHKNKRANSSQTEQAEQHRINKREYPPPPPPPSELRNGEDRLRVNHAHLAVHEPLERVRLVHVLPARSRSSHMGRKAKGHKGRNPVTFVTCGEYAVAAETTFSVMFPAHLRQQHSAIAYRQNTTTDWVGQHNDMDKTALDVTTHSRWQWVESE